MAYTILDFAEEVLSIKVKTASTRRGGGSHAKFSRTGLETIESMTGENACDGL